MNDTPSPSQSPTDLPASPCVGVCTINPATKICIGCLRTLKEIGAWRTMSLDEKRDVVTACKERAEQAKNASS